MLTVALDLRMVSPHPHGIARYAAALWEGLPADPRFRFLGLVAPGTPLAPRRPSDSLAVCRAPFLSPLEQVELPWILRRAGVGLLHATSIALPGVWRGALVLSLHDVNHLALPGWTGPGRMAFYRQVVGPAARRAARVLTGSAFSAREIERWFAVPPAKLRVAPDAIEPRFVRPPDEAVAAVRARLKLPPRYVFHLGSEKSHKNTDLVFRLAERVRVPVLVAGAGLRIRSGSPARLLGPVADDDLPALYAGAELFLYPSRYEGFGLPPLEAAGCGTPVLVARGSSLDEIWEGVAPCLPPDQLEIWVAETAALLASPERRTLLATACARRAEDFRSWQPAIDAAFAAYQAGLRST